VEIGNEIPDLTLRFIYLDNRMGYGGIFAIFWSNWHGVAQKMFFIGPHSKDIQLYFDQFEKYIIFKTFSNNKLMLNTISEKL
jgi:hypothetical protein